MNLKEFVSSLERGGAASLAELLSVSPSYLSQMASGTAPISPARCVEIERATDAKVSRWDLRPDDWHLIWPELVGTKGAPRLPRVRAA